MTENAGPRRPNSALGRGLAILGGMRADQVDQDPSSRHHFIQVALLMLASAMLAFLGGAACMQMVGGHERVSAPLSWLLLAGLMSAAVVVMVQRGLVTLLVGPRGRRLVAGGLVAAVVLAVMGLGITTSIGLTVFRTEVEGQVVRLAAERTQALSQEVDTSLGEVLEAEHALMDAVADLEAAQRGDSSALLDARDQLTSRQAACDEARNDLALERLGMLPVERGGSASAGYGPVAAALNRKVDELCGAALDMAQRAVAEEEQRIAAGDRDLDVSVAEEEVQFRRTDLEQKRKVYEAARDRRGDVYAPPSSGLGPQLEGLRQLVSGAGNGSGASGIALVLGVVLGVLLLWLPALLVVGQRDSGHRDGDRRSDAGAEQDQQEVGA